MKTLVILFTLFYFLNALAVAPYGFKGQQQSTTLYSNVLQGQNNLVTNMGGINALLETGNTNILTNPSFEHATFSTGWTNSAGTFTADTIVEIDGLKAAKLVLSAQTMSLTQSSTLYAAQFADGVQGLASVRVKSDVALKVCSIQAGTVSTTNCVDVVANNKWGLYKVPFIFGATSQGISIASSGSVTGTVYVDDAFVGAVDLTQQVNSCDNARCETDFSVTVGNTGTVLLESMDWVTTCTNVSGTVACTFTSELTSSLSTGMTCVGNREGSSGGTTTVLGGSTTTTGFSFTSGNTTSNQTVYHCKKTGADYLAAKQRANGNTYSSKNADTDWASCGLTGSAFTGFGTVSAIEVQCKRQGADLLMKGKFTSGTSTAVEARMSLPTWNGVQLVSAGTSNIPTIQAAGFGTFNVNLSGQGVVLIEPSVSYATFGISQSTQQGLTKLNGSSFLASGNIFGFNARIPIEGWQGSNIIVGSFSGLQNCTSTLACTDTFSANIDAAGNVTSENTDWILGNASLASSTYTITFNTGVFTVPPSCVTTATLASSATNFALAHVEVAATTSTIQVETQISGTDQAMPFQIVCQKQGADYVGKTALAVASDQNVQTPGVTKAVVYSAHVTDGASVGTVDYEIGDLFNGNCTNASAGAYVCTFNSNLFSSKPMCSATVDTGSSFNQDCGVIESATNISLQCHNSNALADRNFRVICHGISP